MNLGCSPSGDDSFASRSTRMEYQKEENPNQREEMLGK